MGNARGAPICHPVFDLASQALASLRCLMHQALDYKRTMHRRIAKGWLKLPVLSLLGVMP